MAQVETIIDHSDLVLYRTSCDCGYGEHGMHLWIEHDQELDLVTIEFCRVFNYPDWQEGWWAQQWTKLKAAARILCGLPLKTEGEFIFRGPDHILGLLEALNQAYVKVAKNQIKPAEQEAA